LGTDVALRDESHQRCRGSVRGHRAW
jgi:hypothetical protein